MHSAEKQHNNTGRHQVEKSLPHADHQLCAHRAFQQRQGSRTQGEKQAGHASHPDDGSDQVKQLRGLKHGLTLERMANRLHCA